MIPIADPVARAAAAARLAVLTKPPGSLGRLEELVLDLAGLQARARPRIEQVLVLVAAGDHGVCAQGVSAFPAAVTAQMVANFLAGGAAVNVLARQAGVDVEVVNAGVATPLPDHPGLINRPVGFGTADFTRQPAMRLDELRAALELGQERVTAHAGIDAVVLGEMGIGNTTSAAALMAAFLNLPAADCCGRGTGIDIQGLARKITAVEAGLSVLGSTRDPDTVLATLGGFEIAVLTGVACAAAQARIPVIVDGFIATAAALAAVRRNPAVRPFLFFSHRGAEQGHRRLLESLDAEPLLDLGLRLGEGTGGVLAVHLLRAACRLLDEMATFGEAGVSGAEAG